MKFVLINKQDRSKLMEGRSRGMGFAFAKREGAQLIMVQPLSPCKDYCNDVLWSAITKQPYYAHGLNTQYEPIFETGEGYLIFSICKSGAHAQAVYTGYGGEIKNLDSNYKNLQKFINQIEKLLGLKEQTKITQLKSNEYAAVIPLFWCRGTYLISLLTLLMRVGVYYKEGDVMEFLQNYKEGEDSYMIMGVIPKLQKMFNGNIPEQNFKKRFNVHNCGIVEYNL